MMTVEQPQGFSIPLDQLLRIGLTTQLGIIEDAIVEKYGRVVQDGPFKGLKLAPAPHALPKILGTYEQELWPAIEKAISREPSIVINIGCGEGYYGAGMEQRVPDSMIVCYDTDAIARAACVETSRLNQSGLVILDPPQRRLLGRSDGLRSIVVMDCEGAELSYLTEESCADNFNSDLIIECHDFIGQPVTQILVDRLSKTHDIEVIREGPRDTAAIPALANLGSFDRALAVQEWRPMPMTWIAAWARR